MALSQKSWDEIMRVVLHKLGEQGQTVPSLSPDAVLLTLRDNWELVSSKKACADYLAKKDLVAKRLARKAALEQARILAAEIEEIEGGS